MVAKRTYRWLWAVPIILFVGMITAGALLVDQHRAITSRMGWKCVSVQDTAYIQYPHAEIAAFWFRDNPHYEEQASGPSLCADLRASKASDVEMTFDTWGNRFWGFHGYDTTKLAANGKQITLFDSSSGGFHDDEPHYGA